MCSNKMCRHLPCFVLILTIIMDYIFLILYPIGLTSARYTEMRYLYFFLQNLLVFMLLWSILATSCKRPGKVPPFYGHFNQQEVNMAQEVQYNTDKDETNPRWCQTCNSLKPKRTHHCSKCKTCILTYDHHCFALGNCIGFYNKKSFI